MKLGPTVTERVVVDDTFATRDLVADLNHTPEYRLLTISDRTVRSFVGNRHRLVEERDEHWPLGRLEEHSATGWATAVTDALRLLQQQHPLPPWSPGWTAPSAATPPPWHRSTPSGSSPATTTGPAGPSCTTRLARRHRLVALRRRRLPPTARRGTLQPALRRRPPRDLAARQRRPHRHPRRRGRPRTAGAITDDGQLDPTEDVTAPDVVDDIVDETIEAVLRHGVAWSSPSRGSWQHHHIAAVLRY